MGGALFAGVELGGTKCICTLARSPDEILEQETVATTTPEETLGAIEEHLRRWRQSADLHALGIASFGPLDLDRRSATFGFITTTTKPGWSRTDVAMRLQRAADAPMAVDTDVNGAALAELEWGAALGLADVAYVTVGTGIGVGLVCNGQPVHGFAHPELGHIRIARFPGDDWPGDCPFHGDCVEGLASGTALKKRFGTDSLSKIPASEPGWETAAWALAQLCHTLVCAAAPQVILIGGGVANGQPHLIDKVGEMLVESLAGYIALPPGRAYVQSPKLGAMAGPLGSIALAMRA